MVVPAQLGIYPAGSYRQRKRVFLEQLEYPPRSLRGIGSEVPKMQH